MHRIVGDAGRVVAVGDMAALAAALEELLSLPRSEREALGASARERIAQHFEIDQIVKQYERLYRELCGEL